MDFTLISQQLKTVLAKGVDAGGNLIDLPAGTQCQFGVSDGSILVIGRQPSYPVDKADVGSLGPSGTATVSVQVTLPDTRVLTGTALVTVVSGNIVSIVIVVL